MTSTQHPKTGTGYPPGPCYCFQTPFTYRFEVKRLSVVNGRDAGSALFPTPPGHSHAVHPAPFTPTVMIAGRTWCGDSIGRHVSQHPEKRRRFSGRLPPGVGQGLLNHRRYAADNEGWLGWLVAGRGAYDTLALLTGIRVFVVYALVGRRFIKG